MPHFTVAGFLCAADGIDLCALGRFIAAGIKRQFLIDAAEQKLDNKIAHLRKALMHTPCDTTADIGNALHIFTAAKHSKSFVSLDDADHLLSRKSDAVYVANVIAAWSERYIDKIQAAK